METVTYKTAQDELNMVSQQLQEEFFANFNISQEIDPSNLEVLEQIEESLEAFQSQAENDPVASLAAVEGIGESLLSSVQCPPDQSVTLSLRTTHMDLNLIKKSFAEKRPEDKTIMSTNDNIMILPDQVVNTCNCYNKYNTMRMIAKMLTTASKMIPKNTQEELLTDEGDIQITMASHYDLQVAFQKIQRA